MTDSNQHTEKPPFFKTWTVWYWLVAGMLVLKIFLLWWLARSY
jgi:hypothetical protein